jgi:hypothetical protein
MTDVTALQSAHLDTLRRIYAGEPVDHLLCIASDYAGYYGAADDVAFEAWRAGELPGILDRLRDAVADPINFRPPVVEFSPLGVHFVDAFLGARVFRFEDQWWSALLPGSLADLDHPDFECHPLLRWAETAMRAVQADLPAGWSVAGPVFSSPLNVVINLFGEAALMGLVEAEAPAIRGLTVISATLCRLHAWLGYAVPGARFYCSSARYAPDGIGHLCGCSTQLLSAAMYRRYFAPLDAHVLGMYPGGGTIHLCGHHTQHLPTWRAMREVRGVQLNDAAADEFDAYYHGLRDDQVIYIAPTEAMPLDRILDISGGRRVILQGRLEQPVPL